MDDLLKLPSFFAIGDKVRFQPDDEEELIAEWAIPGEIIAVSFTKSKVLYDVQLEDAGGETYGRPLQRVDSVFVRPAKKE